MNYCEQTNEQLLIEIDNKSKAIIKMGKQHSAITPNMVMFYILLIGALIRTVKLTILLV
jgi:hypothetical protein